MPSQDDAPTNKHPALERMRKQAPIDAEKAQIALRITTAVFLLSAFGGLIWNAGATYGRLSSAENTLGEVVPRVDQLRLDYARQETINAQAIRRDDQITRALERIESRLMALTEERGR